MAHTKDSLESDAEICRAYGWTAGTQLISDGTTVIQITAVGENRIMAKVVSHDGRPTTASEIMWNLRERDWDKFDHKTQHREPERKKSGGA